MRKLRILFADPAYGPHTPFWYVPLGVGYLAAIAAHRFGSDVEIGIEREIDRIHDLLETTTYDVVAASNYVWNTALSNTVLEHAKARSPRVVTVQGGPQFHHLEASVAEQYMRQHPAVDYYVYGEAERSFAALVEQIGGGGDGAATSAGLAFVRDGQFVMRPRPDRIQDLDEIPSPYRLGLLDQFLARGFTPILETNRGCPFSCTYCNWGSATVAKVHAFSLERVYDDLDYIAAHTCGTDHLTIADANFGLLPRDRDIALHVDSLWKKWRYPANVHLWYAKNSSRRTIEIAEILGTRVRFLMAVQSLDEEVLTNVKRSNIRLDDYEKLADFARSRHLVTASDLIAGLPGASLTSVKGALRELMDRGSDKVDIYSLLLIPGTELYSQSSRDRFGIKTFFRLADGCLARYGDDIVIEAEEVVVETSAFSREDYFTLRLLKALGHYWHHGGLGDAVNIYARMHGINELDLFLALLDGVDADTPLQASLAYLRSLAERELFPSYEALLESVRQGTSGQSGITRVDFQYAQHLIKSGMAADFIDGIFAAIRHALHASGRDSDDVLAEVEALHAYTLQAQRAIDRRVSTRSSLRYDVAAWAAAPGQPLHDFRLPDAREYQCSRVAEVLPKGDLGTLDAGDVASEKFNLWYDRIRNTRGYFRFDAVDETAAV